MRAIDGYIGQAEDEATAAANKAVVAKAVKAAFPDVAVEDHPIHGEVFASKTAHDVADRFDPLSVQGRRACRHMIYKVVTTPEGLSARVYSPWRIDPEHGFRLFYGEGDGGYTSLPEAMRAACCDVGRSPASATASDGPNKPFLMLGGKDVLAET